MVAEEISLTKMKADTLYKDRINILRASWELIRTYSWQAKVKRVLGKHAVQVT